MLREVFPHFAEIISRSRCDIMVLCQSITHTVATSQTFILSNETFTYSINLSFLCLTRFVGKILVSNWIQHNHQSSAVIITTINKIIEILPCSDSWWRMTQRDMCEYCCCCVQWIYCHKTFTAHITTHNTLYTLANPWTSVLSIHSPSPFLFVSILYSVGHSYSKR